jgi:hypothetical protein
MLEAATNFF